MYDINQILEWLSWNNSSEIQTKGIQEAKKIKDLSVLIMPYRRKFAWENCAKVLAGKNDQELAPYFFSLFKWLQDMNWPGAYLIFDRLQEVSKNDIESAYHTSLSFAIETKDYVWEKVLRDFMRREN